MWIYLSLAVCLIGAVIFFLNSPPQPEGPKRAATWAEVGRIMFGVGLLVFLLMYRSVSTVGLFR